nr:RNA-directed DNA polymerase, eukaryota, reverse transcriptase zinc-binding domain protein [Tanacetum cinerariifolium]
MMSEVIGWYKKKNKKLLIFNVDFEKAFDLVNWRYLDFVQSQLGFGSQWRKWIRACLRLARTSILVNGSPSSEFSIKHDLRQGDSLSPFLFIIVMEGLHLAFNEALQTNLIRGAFVGAAKFNVSHFFFADDVVIRFVNNPNALWSRLIKAIHGDQAGFEFKRCKTQGIWDKIVNSINHLHSTGVIPHGSFKLKVGDGSNVRFWKDTWLRDVPLKARYNRLFHLDSHPNCLISDRFVHDSWQWSWCRQSLGGGNYNSLSVLLNDLHGFQLGSGPKFWQWNLDVDGCFTVGGARHQLDDFFLTIFVVKYKMVQVFASESKHLLMASSFGSSSDAFKSFISRSENQLYHLSSLLCGC